MCPLPNLAESKKEIALRNHRKPLFPTTVLLCVLGTLTLGGCEDSHGGLPEADYEKAKAALEKGLTAWKNGESPAEWRKPDAPIRFVDEAWLKGYTLVEYEIVSLRANIDQFPEAIVRLTTQSPDGKKRERKALYGINVQKPDRIAIGRDPMY